MKRPLATLLFLILASSPAAAQQGHEGSIYSRFGLGELHPFYSSKAVALGGQALAYTSASLTNLANPASLSDQAFVRLSGGILFQGVQTTDLSSTSSRLSSSNFDGLSLGIPLIANKVGLAVAFTQPSRVGYQIDVDKPLDLGDGMESPDTYRVRYEGSGGLNRISLGVGYRLNRRLSVGVRGDMVFGIIEDGQETSFADLRYQDTRIVRSTRLRGLSAGIGARVSIPSLLRDGDFLNLAVAVDLPNQLSGTRIRSESSGAVADTLGGRVKGSADLPVSLALGLLYQPSPKLSWNADVRIEPWSDFSSTFGFPGYTPGGVSFFDDRSRISSGIEYFPAGRDLLASYLERTAYRFGVFRESGYVSPDPSERVNSMGLTGGLSLPTLGGGTRIDINVEVGTRGSASTNLVRDRYLRIGLHFNFAERWFVRRQLG